MIERGNPCKQSDETSHRGHSWGRVSGSYLTRRRRFATSKCPRSIKLGRAGGEKDSADRRLRSRT